MTKIACIALFLASVSAVAADQQVYRSASVDARWLNIPASARVASLAGAFAARGGEPGGIEANPAALAGTQDWQALLTHNSWVQGMKVERFLLAKNQGCWGTFGLGFDYFNLGEFEKTEINAAGDLVGLGTLYPNAMALSGAWAYDFGPLAIGVGVKYIGENLVSDWGSGLQTDLGARWTTEMGWRFGASLRNAALDLSTALRPLVLRAGAGYTFKDQPLALDANVDYQTQDQEPPSYRFAAEWAATKQFILRGGYIVGNDRTPQGPTAGLGWVEHVVELDYAFYAASSGDLGYSHLITLRLVPGRK
ncbi:MAG: PorV/PorQ family protein [candidate division FCPU426 bacterium]